MTQIEDLISAQETSMKRAGFSAKVTYPGTGGITNMLISSRRLFSLVASALLSMFTRGWTAASWEQKLCSHLMREYATNKKVVSPLTWNFSNLDGQLLFGKLEALLETRSWGKGGVLTESVVPFTVDSRETKWITEKLGATMALACDRHSTLPFTKEKAHNGTNLKRSGMWTI